LKRKDNNNRYIPYYKNQDNSVKNTADLFRGSSPTRQGETPGASSRSTARHVCTASEYYGGKKAAGDNKCFYCSTKGHCAYQCPRKSRVPTGKSNDKTVKYTFYNLHNQEYEYENELSVSLFMSAASTNNFRFGKILSKLIIWF
jgi:hypothetical protein